MHKVCCKREDNKQPVCKGEECDKAVGCKYKDICGAKEPVKKTQYGGEITGRNNIKEESRELRDALYALERNRSIRKR